MRAWSGSFEANQPRFVALNGKRAAEVVLDRSVEYGHQLDRLANAGVFVLPSTSAAARVLEPQLLAAVGGRCANGGAVTAAWLRRTVDGADARDVP